jgi:ferrous iron transport protein B
VLTHPVLGLAAFVLVATGLFYSIFSIAAYPMDWIESIFSLVGGWVEGAMPAGILREFLVGGVIGGVGSMVVFLPQICLLFFLIQVFLLFETNTSQV